MKFKFTLLLAFIAFIHLVGLGQSSYMRGKILDYETRKAILGVTVIADTENGALTDKNGLFEFKANTKGLEISFIGYYPVKMINIPADQNSIDFGDINILANHPDEWNGPGMPNTAPDMKTVELDKELKESMLKKYYLKVLGHTLKPSFDGNFFVYDFQKQAGIKQ